VTLRFDEFELDPSTRELRRAGVRVPLQPKAFDLLSYLARNRDRVVSRRELLDAVWPGVHVTGASVGRALKSARAALGDDAERARILLTLPRRGWRFVAPVSELAAPRGPAYVGRSALVNRLQRSVADLGTGQGRALLLSGVAGIGKTRTANEVLGWARDRGFVAASCDASEELPLSPWEALTRALRIEVPRPAVEDRAARFSAVWDALVRSSESRPLALLIDDLHGAGEDAIALLAYAAHDLRRVPVLLLATFRSDELSARPGAARALERVRRSPNVEEIELPPLSPEEVAALALELSGRRISDALAAFVAERIDGNPLYLSEALRAQPNAAPQTPADWERLLANGLSRVIARRLAALAPKHVQLLRAGSVIGHELDAALVSRIAGVAEEEAAAALESGIAAGVLTRSHPGARPTFAHPLFREAVTRAASEAERRALHLRAADFHERDGGELAAARIAHHLVSAGVAGDPRRAIAVSLRAGAQAEREHVFARAAELYERAAELLEPSGADAATAARLWTRLADARRRTGAHEAELAARRALECARAADAPVLFAEAALAFAGTMDRHRLPFADIERVLKEAIARIGSADLRLRASLLARLAAESSFGADRARAAALRAEAVAVARGAGDVAIETHVVDTPFAGIWENLAPDERLRIAERCIDHARAVERRGLLLRGRLLRVGELFARGELAEARGELSTAEGEAAAAHDVPTLFKAALYRPTLALLSDDLERSDRLALEAHALGQRLALDGSAFLGTQRLMVAVAIGRAHEAIDPLQASVDAQAGPSSRALLAWVLAEAGERERCAGLLRAVAERDLAQLRRFPMFVANAAVLARACAFAGARELVPPLEEILAPERGRIAVRGLATAHGPVSFALALCAAARGGRASARALFAEARAQAERARTPLWLREIDSAAHG
jgi:DNA-binding winged helix-turn-helix (wHTH) protein